MTATVTPINKAATVEPFVIHKQAFCSGNYEWHVKTAGQADSVCFLLHGTGASSHSWLPLMHELAERYTVVAIDLPGHAQTSCFTRPDLSLKGMAQAIKQFLADFPVNKVKQSHTVVGHSAGAAIAAQLLLDTPGLFDRIVSVNGAFIPLGGIPGLVFAPVAKISASLPILSDLFSRRLRDPNEVKKLLANTGSTVSAASELQYHELCKNRAHVNGALQMMANWKLESLYPRLSTLSVPVHIVAGANDSMIPVRDAHRLHTLFKDSELTILPGLGHLAHEEQPVTVANIIMKGES